MIEVKGITSMLSRLVPVWRPIAQNFRIHSPCWIDPRTSTDIILTYITLQDPGSGGNGVTPSSQFCVHFMLLLPTVWSYKFHVAYHGVTLMLIFVCCWPCLLVTFDFMFQLNAPFLYYIYHIPLHVSSNFMLIIRRIHCIHTESGSLYFTLKTIEWFS